LLVIPRKAVEKVGQLDVVRVSDGPGLSRRAVQLGRTLGDDVQVLSGLTEGERVAVAQGTGA
jgi:HlyD family secretion protein